MPQLAFLNGGGDMSRRLRGHDWSQSPLGEPETWPQPLRTAVNIMISSKQPMFAVWGPELALVYNDDYAPLLGERHPAALGRPFAEVWADIWPEIAPMVTRALAGTGTWMENLPLLFERDGRPHQGWYTFSYSPLHDEDGSVAGIFCACHETTQQVLDAQRRSADRARLFELSRDLFVVATYDGELLSVNPAWTHALGRSEAELLAHPWHRIVHPDDLAIAQDVVERLQRGVPMHQFQVRLLAANGEALPFAWSAVPDVIGGSRIFYAVGRDIGDDLRREDQRRQSQKLEAVGQLTGGIAHDFNNLLQALQGCLDLIQRRPADAERVRRLAEHGLAATARGARLTTQLLAFSRAQKLELRAARVNPLITALQELLQHSIGPHITVTTDLADGDPVVMCDPTQLEMALLNMAINARDVMPDGGQLRIGTRVCTIGDDLDLAPGDYVQISVADSGPGMSPDVAQRAFDPFFTTKGLGKGTGLGLSQAYAMARQAGGAARIAGTGPQGTVVQLLLQRVHGAPELPAATDAATSGPPIAARRVLLVDDDADVRAFLRDSLETLGYVVSVAEDGEQALASLDRASPDLLLVDFAMPGMNGAEVADRARRRVPGLPVVFATGYAETAAIEEAVGPGATILKKPFRLADLETLLAATLG